MPGNICPVSLLLLPRNVKKKNGDRDDEKKPVRIGDEETEAG